MQDDDQFNQVNYNEARGSKNNSAAKNNNALKLNQQYQQPHGYQYDNDDDDNDSVNERDFNEYGVDTINNNKTKASINNQSKSIANNNANQNQNNQQQYLEANQHQTKQNPQNQHSPNLNNKSKLSNNERQYEKISNNQKNNNYDKDDEELDDNDDDQNDISQNLLNKGPRSKSKSPDKPKSTGNLDETQANNQARTFKLTLKQTLPRPQDISEEDKVFLLPKLSTQNHKLRDQVNGLLDLLENYAISFYSKKQEKYKPERYQPDEQLKIKDKELLDRLNKIRHYQKEIKDLRKQLSESYNIERLAELENEIKIKQNRIKELKDEEMSLKRVQGEQEEAFHSINREGDFDDKINEMAQQLRQYKKQYREIYYEQIDNDKQLIDKHDTLVMLDHKVRKMQHQIKDQAESGKQKAYAIGDLKIITEQDTFSSQALQLLRKEIDTCKKDRIQEEKSLKQKLHEQENEIDQLDHDVRVLELQVREKEQESRLADIKLKELKRTIRHKQLKPIMSQSPKGLVGVKIGKNGQHIKYASHSEVGSKVLKKKLENGRVTYQDVVLTEENVKLHEQKYQQQQTQRYYNQQNDQNAVTNNNNLAASQNVNTFLTDEPVIRGEDRRSTLEKLKGPGGLNQKPLTTPRMNEVQLNLNQQPQNNTAANNDNNIQQQQQQPKRLGPGPSQANLIGNNLQQSQINALANQDSKVKQKLQGSIELDGTLGAQQNSRNLNAGNQGAATQQNTVQSNANIQSQQTIYTKPSMGLKKKQ
eukprot:403332657